MYQQTVDGRTYKFAAVTSGIRRGWIDAIRRSTHTAPVFSPGEAGVTETDGNMSNKVKSSFSRFLDLLVSVKKLKTNFDFFHIVFRARPFRLSK